MSTHHQTLSLSGNYEESDIKRKQARIELRAFKEAYPLKLIKLNSEETSRPVRQMDENIPLKRVAAFCVSEEISLKKLSRYVKNDKLFSQSTMYYSECLYAKIKFNVLSEDERLFSDLYFFEYGVFVTWGLSEKQEKIVLEKMKKFLINEYPSERHESEVFFYGISEKASYFSNDVFYLESEDFFNKMIISNALAQSVKLDYLEEFLQELIESVKKLPGELEKYGKVRHSPLEISKLIGRMHRFKFDINLVSNILDEPEVLWYYPDFGPLYESMSRCLEIQLRSDLLNKRADTISNILMVLGDSNKVHRNIFVPQNIVELVMVCGTLLNIIILVVLVGKST